MYIDDRFNYLFLLNRHCFVLFFSFLLRYFYLLSHTYGIIPPFSHYLFPFIISPSVFHGRFLLPSNTLCFITFSVTHLQRYPWFSSHTLLIHTLLSSFPPLAFSLFLSLFPSFSLYYLHPHVCSFPFSRFSLHSSDRHSPNFSLFLVLLWPLLTHYSKLYFRLSFRYRVNSSLLPTFVLSSHFSWQRWNELMQRWGWTGTDWWKVSSVAWGCKKQGVVDCT